MTICESDIPKLLDGLKQERAHCEVTLRFQGGDITVIHVDRSYLTDKAKTAAKGNNLHEHNPR